MKERGRERRRKVREREERKKWGGEGGREYRIYRKSFQSIKFIFYYVPATWNQPYLLN